MEFESLVNQIDEKYLQLSHTQSWRFLTSPKSTLSKRTDAIFITLNPGGDKITHERDKESCEHGSPYLYESWKGCPPGEESLQKQIQILYRELDWEFDSVLSGQLVPFRSPSWSELPRQGESLEFGIQLWREVINCVKPNIIVAMGKSELRSPLIKILGKPKASETHSVGWGNISASLDIFASCKLLSLPHLSRFKIMGRPQSQTCINTIVSRVHSV
jgi:hypothetical protein